MSDDEGVKAALRSIFRGDDDHDDGLRSIAVEVIEEEAEP